MTQYPLIDSVVEALNKGEAYSNIVKITTYNKKYFSVSTTGDPKIPKNVDLHPKLLALAQSYYFATSPALNVPSQPAVENSLRRMLNSTFDHVVNAFDIQNIYSPPNSVLKTEKWLGEVLLNLYIQADGTRDHIAKWKPVANAMVLKLLKLHPELARIKRKSRRRRRK
jgi:hypothetical protein